MCLPGDEAAYFPNLHPGIGMSSRHKKPAPVSPIILPFRCDEINPRMHPLESAIFEQGSIVKVG